MIFVEMRSIDDRRRSNTVLDPEKERRERPVGRRITDRLKKVKIEENDVFLFKIQSMTDAARTSAKEITRHFREKGAMVIFTLPNVEIEKLPEKQMNKLGWYRK